jgi:hypothetical protein
MDENDARRLEGFDPLKVILDDTGTLGGKPLRRVMLPTGMLRASTESLSALLPWTC